MKHYHKKTLHTCIAVFLFLFGLIGQTKAQGDYAPLVQAIDSNNTGLIAYQKSAEAQKMLNRTGLTPSNPQIGVNYTRPIRFTRSRLMDYNISQSIEFPTVYGHKRNVSNRQNEIVNTDYHIYRADLINQAINTYLNWVYYNQLGEVLKQQKEYAESIATSYQKAFDAGGVNILDRNKAQVNAVNAQKEHELNVIEMNTAYQELMRYNQGNPYVNLPTDFPDISNDVAMLFAEESRFVTSNDVLKSVTQQIELSEAQERLAKAQTLPEFNVGYIWGQEFEADFRGVSFGMTIPLWQQKNTKKYARMNTQALKETQENAQSQYTLQVKLLQSRASELYKVMNELERTISQTRGLELLKKAVDLKEITILEYLVEQSMYFELTQKYLQTKMNLHITLAELYRWEY
ncbi:MULTISPECIES: TolC family protein [Parapedobacter]|uniref:Outer membrane protein TolC n=1 Tax=Parapedobacter indicus TaxID=1477437 RepID=A0A1I3DRM4_9SPHI|nr:MULTISPECIES: TolC family protein [Parapedobacter]MEC3879081.1 TolC family protein [Parapedobacter sp. 10938]PPL04810.1 outer membrane protein TolC [Parapedobacter indicus]SFH89313.1 Outer membrane protein TolC [Parapedobacter indicus]